VKLASQLNAASERDRTALHEAGHAVVAQSLGLTVEEVTVRAEDGSGGVCYVELEPRDSLDAIRRELTFILAGRLATAIARGEDRRSISLLRTIEVEGRSLGVRYGAYVETVAALLKARLADAYHWLDRELSAAADTAVRILTEKWQEVQKLALRLKAEGTVDLAGERQLAHIKERERRARLMTTKSEKQQALRAVRALARLRRLSAGQGHIAAIRAAVRRGEAGMPYARYVRREYR
jgi:hypothetical protein